MTKATLASPGSLSRSSQRIIAIALASGVVLAICASVTLFGFMFLHGASGIGVNKPGHPEDTSTPFYMYKERTQWPMQHTKLPMGVALYYGWAWRYWAPYTPAVLHFVGTMATAVLPEALWEVAEVIGSEAERLSRGRTNGSYPLETASFLYESGGDRANDLLAALLGGFVAFVLLRTLLWSRVPIASLAFRRKRIWGIPPILWSIFYVGVQIAVLLNVWFGIMRKDFRRPDGSLRLRYYGGYWVAFTNEMALKLLLCCIDVVTHPESFSDADGRQLVKDEEEDEEEGKPVSSQRTVLLFHTVDILATSALYASTANLSWFTFPLTMIGCAVIVVAALAIAVMKWVRKL